MDGPTNVSGTGVQEAGTAPTVLVVDDLPMILGLVEAFLTSSGFRVLVAGSGRQALDVCHRVEGRIDLLLTDVRMPDMNGPQLYRRVQARYPLTRVLFMSSFDAFELAKLGMPAGTALLAKPFGSAELLQRLRGTMAAAPELAWIV